MIYVVLLCICAALSAVFTPVARRLATRWGVMDPPGIRKVHLHPVPRLGGTSIALSAVVGLTALLWLQPLVEGQSVLRHAGPILLGGALVFALGLWDDLRPLTPVAKLLIETAVAALVVGTGIVIARVTVLGVTYDLGMLTGPVTVLWIVGLTNAFNLMDGLDGLAAGLGAIAATTSAIILISRGHHVEALLLVALLGATLGFLPYNFHPASIFLGDAGSLLLGFMLAVTAITGFQKGATALAAGVPLLVFALPLAETASSIVRRMWRRTAAPMDPPNRVLARAFVADQRHIHHRLMAGGLSHRATVLLLYGFAAVLSALALLTVQAP